MSENILPNLIDVGVPPPIFRDTKSFRFGFHDFEGLCTTKGQYVATGKFFCFNHTWSLLLYPGGDVRAQEGEISIALVNLALNCSIKMKFWIEIRDANGELVTNDNGNEAEVCLFDSSTESSPLEWSILDLCPRSKIIASCLRDGTLIVELHMKSGESKYCGNLVSENPVRQQLGSLCMNAESADVWFEVKSSKDDTKPSERIGAHLTVLKACAPDLARLCEGHDGSDPVSLNGVEPDAFRALLHYIYGDDLTSTKGINLENHSRDIIDAANRLGVSMLKLEAEVWHVRYTEFTVNNVIEELLYADAKFCPLLKEAAMNFILDNMTEVLASDSFKSVLKSEDITHEIMLAMANRHAGSSDDEFGSLSVNDLRLKLHGRGLDLDGSRDMLVGRLKNTKVAQAEDDNASEADPDENDDASEAAETDD